MGNQGKERLTAVLILLALCATAFSQAREQTDSLVRLMKGTSVQLIEKYGVTYRKATDATFLHNGTYLICDTALWNVDSKVINAEGNVRIIQAETVLASEKLDYLIDENLAQFRGSLVQLQDKDNNTLRTRYLDYNTKDSVAVFTRGASMRDKDGQIIESLEGTYESNIKLFTFRRDVNMFTDSVFVKTNEMTYDTGRSKADFTSDIDFWKDGNMLSSSGGWYDRPREIFFFNDRVHALSKEQEAWADSMYFYRNSSNILMLGNAQVQDTTRNVYGLADSIFYEDTLSRVTMKRNAAVAIRTEQKDGEKSRIDTIYFGADTLIYRTIKRCDVDAGEIKAAEERLSDIKVDPVTEYRKKAAKEAAEAAAAEEKEKASKNPYAAKGPGRKTPAAAKKPEKPAENVTPSELSVPPKDTTALADSLSSQADTLVAPDTSGVGFLYGRHNIRIFRHDMQVCADSMLYNDLDSIARFYIEPVVWNEGTRQYSADSLFLLLRNGGADRASLMSNAFIITKERDSLHFSQIKGPEVMAYFDSTSALKRFDALGGITALFYLEENETIATSNKVETKMMSAVLENGTLDRVYYFESPKNDAMPVAQMTSDDHFLKGYKWQPERRPVSKADVTPLVVRKSERERYTARPRTRFRYTDEYFPGYMDGVYREIATRDSLRKLPPPPPAPDTLSSQEIHSLPADTLAVSGGSDTLKVSSDTVAVKTDTLAVADTTLAKEPLSAKELKKLEREKLKAAKQAAREARWAELDKKDAEKAEARKQKELERRRARGRRILELERRQAEADAAKLEKYRLRFEQRKARQEARRKARRKKPAKAAVTEIDTLEQNVQNGKDS